MLQISSRQAAFTLLELLVALTLSTLVMLTLAVSMNSVLKDWENASLHLEDNLDQVLTLLQIERAFTGAFPHTYRNEKENKSYIFFEGEEDTVTWVSTVSPEQKPGLTAWQLAPSEEKTGIELRMTPAFAGDPTETLKEAAPLTILEDYAATFEYLYVDERIETDSKWEDEWSAKERQSLPYAVRIHLEKPNKENPLEVIAMIPAHEHLSFRPRKP